MSALDLIPSRGQLIVGLVVAAAVGYGGYLFGSALTQQSNQDTIDTLTNEKTELINKLNERTVADLSGSKGSAETAANSISDGASKSEASKDKRSELVSKPSTPTTLTCDSNLTKESVALINQLLGVSNETNFYSFDVTVDSLQLYPAQAITFVNLPGGEG